jgi:hypothetical protein
VNCKQRHLYTSSADSSQGLEAIGNEALDGIRELFGPQVEQGIEKSELSNFRYQLSQVAQERLVIRNTSGVKFIEKDRRYYVLTNDEWLLNKHLVLPNWIGGYCYDSGAILLRENKDSESYCRNTVIHETLHSVSLYSRIWNKPLGIIERHRFLSEGLTECLAGYVLAKKYPECFDTYRLSLSDKCKISYRPTTKLFCSLAQVVGIQPLADFFLSKEPSFVQPWNQLIKSINALGFKNFNFPLDASKVFREDDFRDQCMKLGEFRKIYTSAFRSIDFMAIK